MDGRSRGDVTETRTNHLVLGVAMAASAAVAFATAIAALVEGQPDQLWRAALASSIGLLAWWLRATKRSAMPVIFLTYGVIIAVVAGRRHPDAVLNGTSGIVGVSILAAILTRSRALIVSIASLVLITVAWIRVGWMGEGVPNAALGVIVPMVFVLVGVKLIDWTKLEITGRQSRYENLFEHVPVAIWEEDFSKVATWLDQLRALGVQDLREYLAVNPDSVRYGASLIEVTDVNDETLNFLNADSRDDVLGPLNPDLLVEDSFGALIEEMMAVWDGRSELRIDMAGANLSGGLIEGYLLLAAPRTLSGIDWSRVVIAMVDVSEQLATQRRLQDLVDSKDRFVASVSHELRTPLTTVIGLAEELRNNKSIVPEERAELLELISDQAIDVGNIVEDLLVAAQTNIGRVRVLLEPVELSSEVRTLIGLMGLPRPPATAIVGEVRPIADPRRFRQILRNLITNAYRYGGDSVVVAARVEDDTMVLEVRDNGDGIPDELRDRVFEPYESGHHVDGLTESFGLGLTVSRELARLMGGELSYHRAESITVFQLTLPAAASEEAAEQVATDDGVAASL